MKIAKVLLIAAALASGMRASSDEARSAGSLYGQESVVILAPGGYTLSMAILRPHGSGSNSGSGS